MPILLKGCCRLTALLAITPLVLIVQRRIMKLSQGNTTSQEDTRTNTGLLRTSVMKHDVSFKEAGQSQAALGTTSGRRMLQAGWVAKQGLTERICSG